MTVSSSVNVVQFTADGASTRFAFNYPFFAPGDLLVSIVNATTSQALSAVLNGSGVYDYTVTGNLDPTIGEYTGGASVTCNTAPPAGYIVTIQRVVPATQNTVFNDNTKFPAKAVEAAFDRVTMIAQAVQAALATAITVPPTDINPVTRLPNAAARANMVCGFDRSGGVTVLPSIPTGTVSFNAVFPTVAAIRANTLPLPGTALLSGYAAVADGGEGYFAIDTNDSLSTDNGGTILIDAIGNRWKRQTSGMSYSVKWFGAKGDGVTNDGPAVQACDTAAGLAGRPVYFPGSPHPYIFSPAGLGTNVGVVNATAMSWRGDGAGCSTIAAPAGVTWANNFQALVTFNNLSGFTLHDLTFDLTNAVIAPGIGNPGNQVFHLSITGSAHWFISYCAFLGIQGHNLAVAINNSSYWQIDHCYFYAPTAPSTPVSAAINVANSNMNSGTYEITNCLLIGTQIFSTQGYGTITDNKVIGWAQGGGIAVGPGVGCTNSNVSRNAMIGSGGPADLNGDVPNGIEMFCPYSIIDENSVFGASQAGIFSACFASIITNNMCVNNARVETGSAGIVLAQDANVPPLYFSSDCLVTGNILADFQATPTQSYGIKDFAASPGYYCGNNHVYDNVFIGNVIAPVSLTFTVPLFWRGPQICFISPTETPGTIASGSSVNVTLSVTGARMGDVVSLSYDQDLQGLNLTGYVNTSNTVIATFSNSKSSSVTLSAGKVRCLAQKPADFTV